MCLKKTIAPIFLFVGFLNIKVGYCAVAQILNDSFFQNPAELNVINKSQIMTGNIFINPVFNFSGSSYGANGTLPLS